jgi:hypothetical protein
MIGSLASITFDAADASTLLHDVATKAAMHQHHHYWRK